MFIPLRCELFGLARIKDLASTKINASKSIKTNSDIAKITPLPDRLTISPLTPSPDTEEHHKISSLKITFVLAGRIFILKCAYKYESERI